jgi:CRISPR-associated endonuclease Csn1
MKKILGLDLGSASIGWAVVSESEENGKNISQIIGLGSRIIPYQGTEGQKCFANSCTDSPQRI